MHSKENFHKAEEEEIDELVELEEIQDPAEVTVMEDDAQPQSVSRWNVVRRLVPDGVAPHVPVLFVCLIAVFVAAALVGYSVANRPKTEAQDTGKKTAEWWGCPMDPQVKLPKAGQCPICFMDLVPMEDDSDDNTERRLEMSEAAVKLAGIQTARVERRAVGRVVRMAGKIDHDETRLAQIVSRFPGYLERLYVDYTGMPVGQGEHLIDIYSPDLVVAQRELLQSLATYNRMTTPQDRQMAMTMMQSVEKKIKLLGFSAEQIEEIKRGSAPTDRLTINSPITGIVIEKHATEGMYVQKGMRIYTIADLKHVWLYLDAYESDIAWIHRGQEVQFTTESYPGEVFTGEVTFIYPVLDDKTRTVKVRVNVPNEHMRLKPGMFARASIRSKQPAGDRVLAASLAGKWISPMHPEIVKDGPGTCDICGMPLVPAETLGLVLSGDPAEDPLVIPATAPLITGKRAVVYVKVPGQAKPTFEGREILLGHRAGDYYIVHHGLKLDEEVVKVGSFKIDSSLQILARPSMMSPAELSDDPAAVPAVFRTRLTPIFQTYLVAGGALAADDPATARTAVIRLIELAKQAAETEAKEKLLAPDVRSNWTTVNDRIIFAAHEMLDAKTVPAMRDRFGPLSDSMIRLVKTAGHALPSEMVEFRCKVAREGREGRWLQTDVTVRNPYFGTIRLDCGQQMTTYTSRPPLVIAAEFRREILPVYDAYLKLQQALTYDKLEEARTAWLDMRKAALTVDAKSLAPNAARAWGAIGDQLTESLDENPADFELADFHRPFEAVAGVMLTLADTLGHPYPQPLYQAFCPMAFGDTGAVWLQAKKRPADNPYFVDEMQHCGTVQRTIPPLPSLEPPPSRPAPLQPTEPRP